MCGAGPGWGCYAYLSVFSIFCFLWCSRTRLHTKSVELKLRHARYKTSVNLLITRNLFAVCRSSFHFSLCLPHYASLLCLIFIQFCELLGSLPCTLINYHNDVRPDEVIFFPFCFSSGTLACHGSEGLFSGVGAAGGSARPAQLIYSRPHMCFSRHFRR